MFLVDGQLRLKLMGADALYSLNPKCPPIYFSLNPMPKCIAKYIGVLSAEWVDDYHYRYDFKFSVTILTFKQLPFNECRRYAPI